MASQKDKDYHKLRNPEKYDLDHPLYPTTNEEAEAQKAYVKLHDKYGSKSMVCDKRRRCTTRKSNQRMKKVISRIERAQAKEEVLTTINEILGEF